MNIKSGRKLKRETLSRFEPTKRDLVNIEKIVLKRIKPADHFVTYKKRGKKYSSARYLPNNIKYFRNVQMKFIAPNIGLRFGMFKTEIYMQRVYSKGAQLDSVDEAFTEIIKYLSDDRKAKF